MSMVKPVKINNENIYQSVLIALGTVKPVKWTKKIYIIFFFTFINTVKSVRGKKLRKYIYIY